MHPLDIIKNYFHAWIDNNIEVIDQTFANNIIYSECYGPEYHGISQIRLWFSEWNEKRKVLEWNIKRFSYQDDTLIVEWYFKCIYEGIIDGFDGVTIADFDNDMKIYKLCEFQSKSDHCYPYEKQKK